MEKLPAPPKLPPPPQMSETAPDKPKRSFFEIDIPSIDMKTKPESEQSVSQPRAIPKPPKAQPPKVVEIPKVEIPKLEIKTPKLELQNSNNFVFSEVSLKDFVGEVRSEKSTDLDLDKEIEQAKKKVERSIKKPEPTATISLFGFGQDTIDDSVPRPPKEVKSPRGVPTISKWRENRDGSISGFISGSPAFEDGDAITTSPIVTNNISVGSVVETGSGSK